MKRTKILALVLSLGVLLGTGVVAMAQDSIRETLFEEAKEVLIQANQAEAAYLAPSGYEAGAGHYQRAEELLERGGNIERIRNELSDAVEEWQDAIAATKVAQDKLGNAIKARADARSADAEDYARDAWDEGKKRFREAATALEKGNEKQAKRAGGKAETSFREAELEAIKANYLNETEALLVRADDLKAKRYAPATFASATSLFEEAEAVLTRNRYDTDRPRSLAQDAKHQANLAIYLSRNLRRIGNDDDALEAFLLEWQTPAQRIGAALDMPVYFDNGYEEATAQLVARVEELLQANRNQEQDLQERKAQIRQMESQIESLEERLGGASEERLALAAQLDQQARIRAKFAAVERMFDREEAIVLRSGNDVLLRLVGLTFDSGQSVIAADKFALLKRVEEAIGQFEDSIILVEGHTDAFGNDDNNQVLSTERAESVRAYILANMGLPESRVRATGYGESRPIANNETREGRTKNRRIDIVIRPRL